MHYSWQALLAVWVVIFGVFALIASGTVTGFSWWLMVVGGLAGPAIILTYDEKRRKASSART